ncbi:hypothetical protein vseg_004825 [Gypsophila vaccaria]
MNPLTLDEEVDNPMPINSAYIGLLHGHGRGHHDHNRHEPPPHILVPPSNNNNSDTPPANAIEQQQQSQGYNVNCFTEPKGNNKAARYKECQKNHAASMGGNARDGCGEFMPRGEDDTFEALICSACNCHRNFHRKEYEGEHHLVISPNSASQFYPSTPHSTYLGGRGRAVILGSTAVAAGQGHDHVSMVPFNMAYNNPDNQRRQHVTVTKKRYRTKFSQEQKEKMMEFAERVGWKIQKQEECVVQQFCSEIGVKRKVLKVWMHNNKHILINKVANTNNNAAVTNNNSNSNNISSSSM